MDQDRLKRQRNAKRRKAIEQKRKLRKQIRMYSRICVGVFVLCFFVWMFSGINNIINQSKITKQDAEISSAEKRLSGYLEQNALLDQKQQSLEAAIGSYASREADPTLVDQVYALAEVISKKERQQTDYKQINESYAADIKAMQQSLGVGQ